MENGDYQYLGACWAMGVMGVMAFLSLSLGMTAPYGRYSRAGWGYLLPARTAWLLQEAPSFLCFAWMLLQGDRSRLRELHNAVPAGLFLAHYFNRSFIYPLRIRGGKPTPLVVFLMALFFCVYNGVLQGYYFAWLAPHSPPPPARLWGGVAIFAIGMGINLHSDSVLRGLRGTRGERRGGYKIPRGGMFEYVSAANLLGEIIEWAGWAVAVGSPSAAAFSLFTCCNIGPRAVQHHRWYQGYFKTYPPSRKAIIPFVL